MTLILSNEDVENLLSMPDCIEALETAYLDLAEGRGVSRQRSDCITPTTWHEDAIYGLKSMDGVVKYMAREDARSIGLLGSGWQAETQLTAACSVRKIETIRCFSPNKDNREAFSARMSDVLGITVTPVTQPEEAITGADIVMCGSNSIDPIFFQQWIEEGMHLSSIKKPEIEPAAIRAADKVVVHTHDTSPILVVSKDAKFRESSKEAGWNAAKQLDFKSFPTLPDLIAGRVTGRDNPQQVTCFLNNLGLGYQFAAAGSVIYRRAKERNIGHELPTDWFTETVHP